MKLRDILVVLDNLAEDDQRLAVALRLAVAHGARLTGFSPLDLMEAPRPALELVGYGEAMLADPGAGPASRETEATEAGFRAALPAAGVEGQWIGGDADPPTNLLRLARSMDLLVLRQPDPESPRSGRTDELIEQMLLQSGRPLLLIPYAGRFEALGRNVLIAWTETRESARAVHDSLPLLAGAAQVTVLTIVDPQHAGAGEEPPGAALARHLGRHGIPAIAARTVTENIPDADALLSYACDIGVDLLVMGGYGHSPLRERMLGGVTRSLLRHMTVPVLMSH